MDIVQETRAEAERLLFAGATLASGDFRIKKLLPALDEAAAAAPVIARVALALRRAIGDEAPGSGPTPEDEGLLGPERAAEALMEAYTVLDAILATQARAGADGGLSRFGDAPESALTDGRHNGYGVMGPVAEALSTMGPGRLAILERADKEGILGDFRLLPGLVAALDDGSADIAKIAQRALSAFGAAAIPAIRAGFDPAGGASQQRRLELLSDSGGIDTKELLSIARAEGVEASGQVRAAAIAFLSAHGASEEDFLRLAADRKKEVRVAAAIALCRFDSEAAATAAAAILSQDPNPDLVAAIRASTSPVLAARLLRLANDEYEAALRSMASGKGDKKAIERCMASLSPLPVADPSPVLDFLVSACGALHGLPAGQDRDALLGQCLARILGSDGTARRTLLSLDATDEPARLAYRFFASLLTETPADCFKRFAPILAKGRADPRYAALATAWRGMGNWSDMAPLGLPGFSGVETYDSRWREEFCRLDEPDLVCLFEPRGMPKNVMRYLENKAAAPLDGDDWIQSALCALAQAGSARTVELCLVAFDRSRAPKAGRSSWRLRSAAESGLYSLGSGSAADLSRMAEREKDIDRAAFLAQIATDLASRPK